MSHNEMDGCIHISATSSCGRHLAVQTLGVYSDLPMPTKSPLCLLPACVNIPELFTTDGVACFRLYDPAGRRACHSS